MLFSLRMHKSRSIKFCSNDEDTFLSLHKLIKYLKSSKDAPGATSENILIAFCILFELLLFAHFEYPIDEQDGQLIFELK